MKRTGDAAAPAACAESPAGGQAALSVDRTAVGPSGPRTAENEMVATIVSFDLGARFQEDRVLGVAHDSHELYEGMPGLISKVYWSDAPRGQCGGFYVWESRARAEEVHDAGWAARVSAIYGVAPEVRHVNALLRIENAHRSPA